VGLTAHPLFLCGAGMALNDILISDLNSIIPEIGELVTYTPKGGNPVNIFAVIERNNESRIAEAQMGITYKAIILVSRRDVPTVIRDGDKVTFSMILGTPADDFIINNILSQDASHWKLAVS